MGSISLESSQTDGPGWLGKDLGGPTRKQRREFEPRKVHPGIILRNFSKSELNLPTAFEPRALPDFLAQ
jgi:hypothetical protein